MSYMIFNALLITLARKMKLAQNRACIHKNSKKLPLTGNRGIFWKKHYGKTSVAPKNSYLQIFLRLNFCFKSA